jgi:hypothetical protein
MSGNTMTCSAKGARWSFSTPTGWSMGGVASVVCTPGGALKRELRLRRLAPGVVEFWQTLHNAGPRAREITRLVMLDGALRLKGAGWRAAHHELHRRERYFGGYTFLTGGYFAPVPGVEGEFGLSEDWPFPGFFFTHPERGTVLMAVLSQERCKPHWTLRRAARGARVTAEERFTGVPSIRLEAGARTETERWVMLHTPGDIEEAVEQYYRLLRKRIDFAGRDSILRRAVVWGTWNYNDRPRSYPDITHDMVAANARALTSLVPDKPRFVMIDDGYQRGCSRGDVATWFASSLEIFHDDGTPPHDPALFPKGMKGIADAIRRAGARPALWATIRIHRQSALAKARPEWLLQSATPNGFGVRSAYLDYSLPEVREYTRNAWRTLFREWGYDGLKLDFWSIPFEAPEARYRNRERTAIELRNQFLQDLREFVPKEGFLLVAVVVNGGGSPFVGRYVDAVRMGMDIGKGSAVEVRQSANYLTLAAPFYRHDCLLGDPDSFGWCPRNTPGQNRLWATMTLFTGGMCEIGGDLTSATPEALQLLRTGARFFKPARRTRTGFCSGAVDVLPAGRLLLDREDGRYEARLNWTTLPMAVELPRGARDLWTGARVGGRHVLPPQDAVCFKVSPAGQPKRPVT